MKKFLLSPLVAILFFLSSSAQTVNKSFAFSLGINAAFPTGNFNYVAGSGLGGSAQADYQLSNHVVLVGTVGFMHFGSKLYSTYVDQVLYSSQYISVAQTSILAGVKYHFNKFLYADGKLGASIFNHNGGSQYDRLIYSGTAFTPAIGIGAKLTGHFGAEVNYVPPSASRASLATVNVQVAYTF